MGDGLIFKAYRVFLGRGLPSAVVFAVVGGLGGGNPCYYQAQHVRLGLPGGEKFLGGGRYDDRLRRTPDGWRFTHRRITSVWSEGNPAVISGAG